jgi:hypothetical protein
MIKESKLKIFFWTAFAFLTLFSLTFLIMPFTVSINGNKQIVSPMIVGIIFWLCLVSGLILMILSLQSGRKTETKIQENSPKKKIIFFFSNIPTAIADVCFIIAVAALLILWYQNSINGYLTYVVISIISETVIVHLMFSGNTFEKIKNRKKKEGEQADENKN